MVAVDPHLAGDGNDDAVQLDAGAERIGDADLEERRGRDLEGDRRRVDLEVRRGT